MAKDLITLDSERLNLERLKRGWTRKELAARARVSVNSLRPSLDGESVGLSVAVRVTEALGIELRRVLRQPRQVRTKAAEAVA